MNYFSFEDISGVFSMFSVFIRAI